MVSKRRLATANVLAHEISWDEFEQRLIRAGWKPEDAKKEREANQYGQLGDCDGDLEP